MRILHKDRFFRKPKMKNKKRIKCKDLKKLAYRRLGI